MKIRRKIMTIMLGLALGSTLMVGSAKASTLDTFVFVLSSFLNARTGPPCPIDLCGNPDPLPPNGPDDPRDPPDQPPPPPY